MVYNDMRFYTFAEFYQHAIYIKHRYDSLDEHDKCVYKMYIYSNRIIREYVLDKIWEYLNEPMGSCYYVSFDMLGFYLN